MRKAKETKDLKNGDTVNVYGTVATDYDNSGWKATVNFCYGSQGIVVDDSWGECVTVKITKDTAVKSRSLIGKIVEVHKKQCRKVKK
jgi:hypothetical protein